MPRAPYWQREPFQPRDPFASREIAPDAYQNAPAAPMREHGVRQLFHHRLERCRLQRRAVDLARRVAIAHDGIAPHPHEAFARLDAARQHVHEVEVERQHDGDDAIAVRREPAQRVAEVADVVAHDAKRSGRHEPILWQTAPPC